MGVSCKAAPGLATRLEAGDDKTRWDFFFSFYFFFVLGNVPPSQQNRCAFTFAALWWWLTDFMPDIQKRLFLKALHGWPASSSGLLLPAKWGWFTATSYCSSFFFMLRKGARGKNVLFSEWEKKKKVHYFAAFLLLQHLIYSVVRSSSRNHLDKRCVEIPKANIHHMWTGTVIDFSSLNKVNQDTMEQLQHRALGLFKFPLQAFES